MSEEQNEKAPQSNETGSFRFAVTSLAALGTILYVVYNYLQTTPIDPNWHAIICVFISVALILVGGFLAYILIKGYSLEVQNLTQKDYLPNLASSIYLLSFLIFIMLLAYLLCVFALIILKIEITELNSIAIMLITIAAGIVFTFPFLRKKPILIVPFVSCVFIIVCLFLLNVYPSVVDFPALQGHIIVDMESIYYKNDAPIPVLIHVTGPNTGLSIYLVEEKSDHNLDKIDRINYLEPECNIDKTVSSEKSTLIGNALNYGTYSVFINTTNLTAGYHELRCERQVSEKKTYGARGFYLLNSSQQSCIKE
ncbi:MAG: hypothetical protein U9N41_04685 [Euryarchaeota archaeon]|nr:hypothetical protein [Euryarchaeota archaeon]